MADFLFDGITKVMTEPVGTGDTVALVSRDIYSAWKRWVQSGTGAGYLPAFVVEGGTPIGNTGIFTGTTFVLINGWKIRPANHDHQLLINGNVYSDDGIVSIPAVSSNTNVFVNASVAAQGVSSGSGLTNDQAQKLTDARDFALAANLQTQPL